MYEAGNDRLSNDQDPRESFFTGRRDHLRDHLVQRLFRHHAKAASIAFLADLGRNFEEHRIHWTAVAPADLDVWTPLLRRKMCRIHIRHRAFDRDPMPKQVAQRREDSPVNRLIGYVVGQ